MDNSLILSYNNLNILAHVVKGNKSDSPIVKINKDKIIDLKLDCINPAYGITNLNFLYVSCESIFNGEILTINLDTNEIINKVSSGGKSSCYLLMDENKKNLININYWDSTITVHPITNNIVENYSQIIIL